ncbi:hypothetical protein AR457_26375 [Streptomyces agglomeratus]|uniref:Uncharacterized protein n=1 Tax=Streptomyces agglomeratus TaxID=285458 RepID=A0A1E5PDK4_9ACTN|nr:hypothetical protein [Streptomyces agglomeratus]OEJ27464.1 hypothetical protein AS594_26250 [Streptomyces agglomeratus]OEJ38479.1 hypothetical protein BGK70_10280 [Streptomyces agglomeratus]OEJ47136.1 hypothetical protein AR457_26375 [Streptomyces agglomeratus]OEJ51007.1 hypothetical protein BGK72_09765 [Streptomyces agglomeratus]OEJ58377.1 hypothetical protein BGM19_10675 [Streptomyces agglomeratus]
MTAQQARVLARWITGCGAVLMAVGLPAAAAHADETHNNGHNGPRVMLISTGQIDDPLEDVLEHATVLGRTYMAG